MKFENKTLLILTDYFPNEAGSVPMGVFVKSQVDELKNYFNKIIVISPTPYAPKILRNTGLLTPFQEGTTYMEDYSYDNVEVYFPKFYTAPLKFFRERNADLALPFVKKCIKKNNIKLDFIHAHFTWMSGYIGTKLKKEFGKKLFVHSRENKGWFNQLIRSGKAKEVWSKADAVIRVNKRDIPEIKKFNKQAYTVYNGVDTDKFKPLKNKDELKKKYNLPLKKKIILNVGTLRQKHKNQLTLLKATKQLNKIRKDFVTILVGSGEDEKKFREYVAKNNLENQTIFLGRVPHDKIPDIMNTADVFAFPSFHEGNPNVFFESQACGIPYVGTNVGDVGELIRTPEQGRILKDESDFQELAEAIQHYLCKEIEEELIVQYIQKFKIEDCVSILIEDIYNE